MVQNFRSKQMEQQELSASQISRGPGFGPGLISKFCSYSLFLLQHGPSLTRHFANIVPADGAGRNFIQRAGANNSPCSGERRGRSARLPEQSQQDDLAGPISAASGGVTNTQSTERLVEESGAGSRRTGSTYDDGFTFDERRTSTILCLFCNSYHECSPQGVVEGMCQGGA